MNAVIDANGRGASAVPAFVSSALMPALDETNNFMVLAPDQLVDADPAAAAAAIDDTAGGPFIPITVGDALANVDSYDGGDLTQPSTAGDDELPAGQLTTARAAVASTASLSGTLTPADAATLLGGFPAAIQRSESSAWRSDRAAGEDFANSIAATATDLTNKIKIVPPKNGSYSLASSDSPLILTVQNTLTSPVSVRVAVSSVGDVKGFTAQTSEVLEIPAGEQRTVRVQAHVDRSGHFKVMAALTSPSGSPVGEPARLTIYSKALGTIGIMITVVAGSVLAVALLIRFSRRFQARRKRRAAEALVAAAAPMSDDWSTPSIFGTGNSVIAEPRTFIEVDPVPPQLMDEPENPWSSPTYHGPRRHRPGVAVGDIVTAIAQDERGLDEPPVERSRAPPAAGRDTAPGWPAVEQPDDGGRQPGQPDHRVRPQHRPGRRAGRVRGRQRLQQREQLPEHGLRAVARRRAVERADPADRARPAPRPRRRRPLHATAAFDRHGRAGHRDPARRRRGPVDHGAGRRTGRTALPDQHLRDPAAARDLLLRPGRPVHGRPQHPQRLRARSLGTGDQQRDHHRDRRDLPGPARALRTHTDDDDDRADCW